MPLEKIDNLVPDVHVTTSTYSGLPFPRTKNYTQSSTTTQSSNLRFHTKSCRRGSVDLKPLSPDRPYGHLQAYTESTSLLSNIPSTRALYRHVPCWSEAARSSPGKAGPVPLLIQGRGCKAACPLPPRTCCYRSTSCGGGRGIGVFSQGGINVSIELMRSRREKARYENGPMLQRGSKCTVAVR